MRDLLEKKWTSVVRLKKQVLDLEKQNKQLKESQICERCEGMGDLSSNKKSVFGEGLPREPERYSLQGHRSKVTKVALHPVFSMVASASDDASIRLWDTEQGEPERTLKSHTGIVQFIAFHPNGQLLASSSNDMTVKLWNLKTYTVQKTLQGHEHEVSGVCFLPSGDHLVSCSRDQTIKVWDTLSGYCLHTLRGHQDWVRRVAVDTTGKLLASCSKDETIIVWDMNLVMQKKGQDSMLQVLHDHEHVIDVIKWALPDSNKEIEKSSYNQPEGHAHEDNEDKDNENKDEEVKEGNSNTAELANGSDAKQTTRERIKQMKDDLKKKRLAMKEK